MKLGWISCGTFGETVIHMVAAEPVQIVDKSRGSRGIYLISICSRALDTTGTRATIVATNQILCNLIGEEGIKSGRHDQNCGRTKEARSGWFSLPGSKLRLLDGLAHLRWFIYPYRIGRFNHLSGVEPKPPLWPCMNRTGVKAQLPDEPYGAKNQAPSPPWW